MKVEQLHPWNLAPRDAIELQRTLASKLDGNRPPPDWPGWRLTAGPYDADSGEPVLIAGVDASYSKFSPIVYAGVVVWNPATGAVVEERGAVGESTFPYIPGLLSFREAPTMLEALAKLENRPAAILVDGAGRMHPRRIGIACHLGLLVNLPTVGCAKSRLCGEHDEPSLEVGAGAPLVDRGEEIGRVLRTRRNVKPMYVSVGSDIDLETAVALVLACGRGLRLPEPTRLAHQYVNRLRLAASGNESET
ncbi:MAG: endonuclease V [Planctomycetia bacterium]